MLENSVILLDQALLGQMFERQNDRSNYYFTISGAFSIFISEPDDASFAAKLSFSGRS